MKDGVPKQTGNSRFLKSAISSNITFEQFRDMLRNGTLPIDINGINASGWAELGTPLNKASLMSGTVESQYGLSSTNVPSDVFVKIKSLIDAVSSTANSKIQLVIGSYIGDAQDEPPSERTISLGFKPKAVLVVKKGGYFSYPSTYTDACSAALITESVSGSLDVNKVASIEQNGFRVYEYVMTYAYVDLNGNGIKYNYIAFK